MNSLVLSNFSYCPLIWSFLSARQCSKIDKIIEKSLKVIDNENSLTYKELLNKYEQSSIKHRAHKVIATEIYKTFNNLNPEYMRKIFQKIQYKEHASNAKFEIAMVQIKKWI